MSNAETEQALGRAHIVLRQSKSKVAVIKASLLEHAKALEETGRLVRQFIDNPTYKNPSHIPLASQLKAQAEAISQFSDGLIDELVNETRASIDLQEQVDQF